MIVCSVWYIQVVANRYLLLFTPKARDLFYFEEQLVPLCGGDWFLVLCFVLAFVCRL